MFKNISKKRFCGIPDIFPNRFNNVGLQTPHIRKTVRDNHVKQHQKPIPMTHGIVDSLVFNKKKLN